MTTIDLLQRFPTHKDFTHHDKAPDESETFDGKKPKPTMPNPDPSQSLDTNTKLLHDMLDRAVKDIASSRPEPVSEYEGTFWRSPLLPKPRSPTYSDISDSFESSDRIEHCTNVLLSTPMSPASNQFKGPDGWPLGIEVAMNDFHRGRLSTSVLEEKWLPNPMVLRKRKQQTPRSGGNGNQEWQETASREIVPSTQHGNGGHRQESGGLKPLVIQKQQTSVPSQSDGERKDHLHSVSLEPLASQQQTFTNPQQESDCQLQQEGVDLDTPESQLQSGEGINLDLVCIPTLNARKFGDDQNSRGNASSELHPDLANGKLPIGLGLKNARLQPSIFQPHSEDHDGSHKQVDDTCLIQKGGPQRAPSDSAPRNIATHEETHKAVSRINDSSNALDEKSNSAGVLGAYEHTGVESIDSETGGQKTFEDSKNGTLQGTELQTPKDGSIDIDSDIVSWKSSGPLEDILEESEDQLSRSPTLDQGQPQHFTLGSAEPLDLQRSSWADDKRNSIDSMVALQEPQTKVSTLSLRSQGARPTLKLTIDSSSTPQHESTKPSTDQPIGTMSSESTISATTMTELRDPNRKKGRLSAAALAELRKTAESQPHFQIGPDSPKDRSQAQIHPLLRSKSFSRPFSQHTNAVKDSPLKYVFEDDDDGDHKVEETDSFSNQVTMKRRSLLRPEGQDPGSFIKQISTKEDPSQLDEMTENTVPRYLCNDDDTEAECGGTFTSQKSTLSFSNDTTVVPSPENATPPSTSWSKTSRASALVVGSPDLTPSFVLQPSNSLPMTGYYPNSAIRSPAAYNSWASTPHHHKHGNCSSTPSSGATLLTNTVPTPNTSFHGSPPTSLGTTMTPSSSFGQFASKLPTHHGIPMTPSSSFGQFSGKLTTAHEIPMTPSSSFGQFSSKLPTAHGIPMTPSSSFGSFTGNRTQRRSLSASTMFTRSHKARYQDHPTAAMTDAMVSSNESAEKNQPREVTNDPFTSTGDTSTSFSLNLKAPSKEDLPDALNIGDHQFNTPTKRSSRRFSLPRRSLSTSERPSLKRPSLERALSTIVFSPNRARLHKRSHSISGSIDTTSKQDSTGLGNRRSLSIATSTAEQKWELAPPPTPLLLRDDFSMRYRPEPLQAEDHYSSRKDAVQGPKQGWKKVFGRK